MATSDTFTPRRDVHRQPFRNHYLVLIAVIAFFLIAVVVGFYWYRFGGTLSPKGEDWGQFGDYVGGVLNPVIGFVGLIAILITIRIQAAELTVSTQELARSATALTEQLAALRQQNFENTFFQMMRLFNEIAQSLTVYDPGSISDRKGREAFRILRRSLREKIMPKQATPDDAKASILAGCRSSIMNIST